ncbi:MAG TPA: NAD-glutamate dehydrogenase domain-containing protein, partial [Terriglobales bacterium]|nr:NAD-glutamate dehydrogenase domain-containing protein [Terriglobales bacterium]
AAQLHDVAGRDSLEAVLLRFPQSARLLWEYFAAKFDPLEAAAPRDRLGRALPEIEQRFSASLQSGQSPNETRLLRLMFGIVRATVRTNFFRASASGKGERIESGEDLSPLAVKIESARIPEIGGLRPASEIFVDGPAVQGIYIRSGRVARGGVFFLDAPDQLRMRVLDGLHLLAEQTGATVADAARGAFTVRRESRSPITVAQVQAAYRLFVDSLIGLMDDIEQGRVAPPAGTVLYDEPDPFLQLGDSALPDSYSDLAKAVAAQVGFWIGEAIAPSSPRTAMAAEIGARGAWEAVRRHFQEIGVDADRESLSVIAIGRLDDAQFARGLLLSRRLQVRAGLDEQWIFLDPDPDVSRSYVERERLAALPGSSWSHYDKAMLSEGGGIFARSARRIELHPVLRGMLGIDRETASGEEIARAVLRLPADLLWCGDAGIYVKAEHESHAEVGDAGNDAVRIDARELRSRVVVEIGPALTQAGRVAVAVAGGRLNGVGSDGAAAVVLGDRESNVRIAVAACGEGSALSTPEQARVMQEVGADNATEVLANSHHRVRALSREQSRSQVRLDEWFDLLAQMEVDKVVDRRLERLPDRETVRRRRAQFNGLTRPELAVFANASKIWLRQRLLATDLPDDAFFERYLRDFFPTLVNDRCGQGVRSHRLRRNIIAARLANTLIDMMGVTFVTRIAAEAGVEPVTVVRAWAVVSLLSGGEGLWREIVEADPPLPVPAENACWDLLVQALERATRWLVFTQPPEVAATVLADTFNGPARELLNALPALQPQPTQQKSQAIVERIAGAGVPRAL